MSPLTGVEHCRDCGGPLTGEGAIEPHDCEQWRRIFAAMKPRDPAGDRLPINLQPYSDLNRR